MSASGTGQPADPFAAERRPGDLGGGGGDPAEGAQLTPYGHGTGAARDGEPGRCDGRLHHGQAVRHLPYVVQGQSGEDPDSARVQPRDPVGAEAGDNPGAWCAVGGDAAQGGALAGGQVPRCGGRAGHRPGRDRAVRVEPGGEQPVGVPAAVEERQAPFVVRPQRGPGQTVFGGVHEPAVQTVQQIRPLGEDAGERHRGTNDGEGGTDADEEPGAQ
ncbi:hypothetical protein ABZ250_37885 [Streptomyces afghaniensis]|uniref:hypothetical protein n=1 Tax=Streptomyces afghaniensis TaxID=66865 RepID=UPI0033BF4DEA